MVERDPNILVFPEKIASEISMKARKSEISVIADSASMIINATKNITEVLSDANLTEDAKIRILTNVKNAAKEAAFIYLNVAQTIDGAEQIIESIKKTLESIERI